LSPDNNIEITQAVAPLFFEECYFLSVKRNKTILAFVVFDVDESNIITFCILQKVRHDTEQDIRVGQRIIRAVQYHIAPVYMCQRKSSPCIIQFPSGILFLLQYLITHYSCHGE